MTTKRDLSKDPNWLPCDGRKIDPVNYLELAKLFGGGQPSIPLEWKTAKDEALGKDFTLTAPNNYYFHPIWSSFCQRENNFLYITMTSTNLMSQELPGVYIAQKTLGNDWQYTIQNFEYTDSESGNINNVLGMIEIQGHYLAFVQWTNKYTLMLSAFSTPLSSPSNWQRFDIWSSTCSPPNFSGMQYLVLSKCFFTGEYTILLCVRKHSSVYTPMMFYKSAQSNNFSSYDFTFIGTEFTRLRNMDYGNNKLVVILNDQNTHYLYIHDGDLDNNPTTWTQTDISKNFKPGEGMSVFGFLNDLWVIWLTSGDFLYSTDLQNWTRTPITFPIDKTPGPNIDRAEILEDHSTMIVNGYKNRKLTTWVCKHPAGEWKEVAMLSDPSDYASHRCYRYYSVDHTYQLCGKEYKKVEFYSLTKDSAPNLPAIPPSQGLKTYIKAKEGD